MTLPLQIGFATLFGFLLTAVLGLAASWVDRKVTARVQYRVGPPLLQPAIDIVKLLGKETVMPAGASRIIFLGSPLLGLTAVVLVSTMLWMNAMRPGAGFLGDLIVVVYLLVLPSISIILGGFASGNPLASLGASREMKLILAYELPFLLALLVPIIHAAYSLRIDEILAAQRETGANALHLSGFLALCVTILCLQAKLALVPFDMPEAETEIAHGPLIDYSGTPLAIYRLTKNMLLFILPFFAVTLFMGGLNGGLVGTICGILKLVGIVATVTVIRNTNPRVRIDQAIRFFWGPVTGCALLAVALALLGW